MSLVVSSILLTLLAVILAAAIFNWARNVVISFSPEVDCFGMDFKAEIIHESSGLYYLNAVNLGNLKIDGFYIKFMNGEEGSVETYEELYVTLEPGRSDSFGLTKDYAPGRYLVVPRVEGEDGEGKLYFKACKDIYGVEVVLE